MVDTYENEENEVVSAIQEAEQSLREEFLGKFQVDLDVPLTIECKMGPNWMDVG